MQLYQRSLKQISTFFNGYETAPKKAIQTGKTISLYGTGTFGLIATKHRLMKKELIKFIFDDNSSIWGSSRIGIQIVAPERLKKNKEVTQVVISSNLCYVELIANKVKNVMTKNNINICVPKL